MIKEYLELGQIVSTHGVRGEMRFDPWCDSPSFVKKFKTLYFDASGENMKRLCKAAGTINYEALCLISKRVERIAVHQEE